jgi:hypothetical protein
VGLPVIGKTAFIVGIAEPNIGRLAYLNCRYGITTSVVKKKKVTDTKIEIGLSIYKSSAQAAARVKGTIEDYRSHGARKTDTTVGSHSATLLTGYGQPTLVVAAGVRTVAVSMSAKLVHSSTSVILAGLAKAALDSTGDAAASSSDSASASATNS